MQSFQRFPHSLTTVTAYSKFIALILFICLPFFGFALGMNYQQKVDVQNQDSKQMIVPKPTTNPTANWKMYINTTLDFSIQYPESFIDHSKLFKTTQSNAHKLDVYSPDTKINPYTANIINGIELQVITSSNEFINTNDLEKDNAYSQYLPQNVRKNSSTYTEPLGADRPYIITNISLPENHIIQLTCIGDLSICKKIFPQILYTFKFLDQSALVTPTCMPRPACLDASPRCMIAEPAQGWCTSSSTAQIGEHCGGNMSTAKQCVSGTHCAPDPNSHLPFGDVGGTCVRN